MAEVTQPVPLIVLTGFLGSGKTTLLNRLIRLLPGKRLGILLNDFGDQPVDGAFLHREGHVVRVTELNGGQIFCSCLSGSFVQSVASYAGMGLDYLFVECSGLAKPAPIMEILGQVMSLSDRAFDYRGMICLIDAESYEDLADVLNVLDEQLYFSDSFIINKADLADADTLGRIRRKIRLYHPDAPMVETSHAEVELSVLDIPRREARGAGELPATWDGWGAQGRPYTCCYRAAAVLSEQSVRRFVEAVAPHTFRIKGLLQTEKGFSRVDCVGPTIHISPYADQHESTSGGLVLISRIGRALQPLADAAWIEACGSVQ